VDAGVNERMKERKKEERKKERKKDGKTEMGLFLKEAIRRFGNSETCYTGSRSSDGLCSMLQV